MHKIQFIYCMFSTKYDFHFNAALRKFECECWQESWQNLYLIAFIFSIKQKKGSSVDSNREDGQIKYLLKVKKSFEGSEIFCMEQETREKQNCLGHAESSAEVGQYEFKVFPNFPVFWFPLPGLRCPVQTQGKQTLVESTKNEKEGCWSVKSTMVPKA